MVRAMSDQLGPLSRASALLVMVSAVISALAAVIDPTIGAAMLPDRQAAGVVGTAGAFGLALLLGEFLHRGGHRLQQDEG